jgi:hypothetical protein
MKYGILTERITVICIFKKIPTMNTQDMQAEPSTSRISSISIES